MVQGSGFKQFRAFLQNHSQLSVTHGMACGVYLYIYIHIYVRETETWRHRERERASERARQEKVTLLQTKRNPQKAYTFIPASASQNLVTGHAGDFLGWFPKPFV